MVNTAKKEKKKETKQDVDDTLVGMKAICDYAHRSEPTVLGLIRSSAFPAVKVGGIWESSRVQVDMWRDKFYA